MDGVFMSSDDQVRFRVVEDFRSGKLTRKGAALKLGKSERTVSRVAKKMRRLGMAGIKHGNFGRVPVNKIGAETRGFYIRLYREKYPQFNFSHALEKIIEMESPPQKVSYSTFRRWCREVGLGKVRRRRRSKAHLRRERMANEGYMLQLDGSPHKWNGKDEWTLIATIDDATSDVPIAEFFESETTLACMGVLRRVIECRGVPEFILTDCAGWSTGSIKRNHFSQFVRACQELDIRVIGTPSAQSKGRVERLNRTMQDRLIPELALLGIKAMKDANRYLDQVFLPDLRRRISVEPRFKESRYRPIPNGVDLNEVFCCKYLRTVNRDHTVQFGANRYRLEFEGVGSLWKHQVEIRKYEDGTVAICYQGRIIKHSRLHRERRHAWMGGNKQP